MYGHGCDAYVDLLGGFCDVSGRFSNASNVSSMEACCHCGGGDTVTAPMVSSPPPSPGCTSLTTFCDVYDTHPDLCALSAMHALYYGVDAKSSCCACGGGSNDTDVYPSLYDQCELWEWVDVDGVDCVSSHCDMGRMYDCFGADMMSECCGCRGGNGPVQCMDRAGWSDSQGVGSLGMSTAACATAALGLGRRAARVEAGT